MNLIRIAIDRPIAVIAAVLMAVMFGYVALTSIPIQLAPDVDKPVITIQTQWRGAAPAEIEREITNKQEDVLNGLDGLETISSSSQDGRARVTLEFAIGTNMDKALCCWLPTGLMASVAIQPKPMSPASIPQAARTARLPGLSSPALPGNERPIHTYGDFADDVIEDRLQRISGYIGGRGLRRQRAGIAGHCRSRKPCALPLDRE